MRRGRKPAGAKLVDGLEGSDVAKERLRAILRTLSGEATIEEACSELNLSRSRFCDLRQSVLAEMVGELEPRPAGRPRQEPEVSEEVQALEEKIAQLEVRLKVMTARAELNAILPLQESKKRKR